MEKSSKFFAVIAMLFCSMTVMASAADKGGQKINVPDALEAKAIEAAKSYGVITEKEAASLAETQAVQQCVDAFVASGFEPAAAVDKLAEIAVEQGYASNKQAAKRAMKRTVEKARTKESLWSKLYDILGL